MSMGKSNLALGEFIAEVEETIDRLNLDFAAIEKGLHNDETLNSVYRDMHTVKGSAQLFGCLQMGKLAHAMETCLEPIRDGSRSMTPELVDALYLGTDFLKKLVHSLKKDGHEPDVSDELALMLPRFEEISRVHDEPAREAPHSPAADAPQDVAPEELPSFELTAPSSNTLSLQTEDTKQAVQLVRDGTSSPSSAEAGERPAATLDMNGGDFIRVQVDLLDSLMNLVGELVLIRNQVIQHTAANQDDVEFINLSQRLNIVTTELQNEVMKTRMQPIGNILSKFQRIVRDMSRELNKAVELKLDGGETELDKTLIEAVKDPLTHIVRNAIDHGIESPQTRLELGKPRTGTVAIRSYHEGGQVVVEVSDDGQGLSRARISEKALAKNLVTRESLDKMSDREVYNLIFLPGFSTADKVSNISGRGVGMDVVRTNIEKIGGVVDLNASEGVGMTLRLKIPLTLAIVPALIVRAGDERFAIPQVKLIELVRIDHHEKNAENDIQMLQDQPIFRLRGDLLPLVSLASLLKLDHATSSEELRHDRDTTNIAVLNADTGLFGLIVDGIDDSTDIVVKPLSPFIKGLGVYSGATVLGDGSVALVLDVLGLASKANIFDETARERAAKAHTDDEINPDVAEYLVLDIGAPGRYALPLCLVNRLEEFPHAMLERSGHHRVVQYRGEILPIISIAQDLTAGSQKAEGSEKAPTDKVAVVVVERAGRQFGLEVRAILDVIAIDSVIDTQVKDHPSILGTSLHPDGVIVIFDAYKIIDKIFFADLLAKHDAEAARESTVTSAKRSGHHILLAEDNAFFRKRIIEVLTEAGYLVTPEINGENAWNRLHHAQAGEFSLLLSDIEMPRLNGLHLARKVRSEAAFAKLPLIALTTKSRASDREIGLKAGFDRYLEKLNGEQLVREIDDILGLAEVRLKYGT